MSRVLQAPRSIIKSTSVFKNNVIFRQTCPNVASTIDANELETFSPLAKDWWDTQNGPLRGLHTLNKLRVPFIVKALSANEEHDTLANKKILDVGCGGGILCEALAHYGAKVTGIDATKDVITIASQHSEMNADLKIKPTYQCTTVEDHVNLYKNYYDAIVASEVIEHINNKALFVKACVETLKPGGRIFFTTPSKTRLSQILNIWFAENILNLPPKGTHQYEKFMTPSELQSLLESNWCSVEETRGFIFNMFAETWSWTKTKSLFFAMHAIKKH